MQRCTVAPVLQAEAFFFALEDRARLIVPKVNFNSWIAGRINHRSIVPLFAAVEYETLEWVGWFNNRRLLEPISNVPPAEFEQAYYDQLEVQAVAA